MIDLNFLTNQKMIPFFNENLRAFLLMISSHWIDPYSFCSSEYFYFGFVHSMFE